MKYRLALLVCGIAWFGLARLCLHLLGASSELPVAADLLCAITTAMCVGALFEVKIRTEGGLRYFVLLPLATLVIGVLLYSILISFFTLILLPSKHATGVNLWSLLVLPALTLIYSLTLFLPLLYPSSVATNTLLRRVLKAPEAPNQHTVQKTSATPPSLT